MIAVVSCVWQRPERLLYTLVQLGKQQGPFHLHLISNNPDLHDFVGEAASRACYPVTVWRNAENRGPYARIELMHALSGEYDWFMTLDDDALFCETLLDDWRALRSPDALMGWQGFCFTGDYWQRETVEPGQSCSYLWGSNLLVPAAAVRDERVLNLDRHHWQCDDLWLCYHAQHVEGLRLVAQRIPLSIRLDGKDTYHGQHYIKRAFLQDLRERGWSA